MTDEPTKKIDTGGDKVSAPIEENKELNPLFTEAKSLAERIEEGNKKSEELLKKQEQLLAASQLSGTAGGHLEPKEETPKEYAQRVLAGKL